MKCFCHKIMAAIMASFLFTGLDGQLYQWTCSPLDADRNQYSLPDLPIASLNGSTLGPSDPAFVHIFPLPSALNCNGMVVEVRFFYNPMLVDQSSRVVFTLLTLEQNGLSFVITDKINHSEQASANCTTLAGSSQMICSDTMILDEDSIFSLPVDNFAFGIVSSSLYAMRFFELPEFRVEHYRFDHESPFPNGVSNFTLNGSIRNDRALRLVEFGIAPLPPTEQQTTSPDPTTMEHRNSIGVATTLNSESTDATQEEFRVGLGFLVGIIGGGIGIVAVIALVLVIVAAAMVVARSRRKKKNPKPGNSSELHRPGRPYGHYTREPSQSETPGQHRNAEVVPSVKLAKPAKPVKPAKPRSGPEMERDEDMGEYYNANATSSSCLVAKRNTTAPPNARGCYKPQATEVRNTKHKTPSSGAEQANSTHVELEELHSYEYVAFATPPVETTANLAYGFTTSFLPAENESREYMNTFSH